ncbi:hypothetical protein GCM10027200_38970 [Lentzea nigeriaca]
MHTAPKAQRLAIIIAYGGVGVINLAFITLMLVRAARHLSFWTAVPIAAYAALLIPIGLAWRTSTARLDFRASAGDRVDPELACVHDRDTGREATQP